MDRSDGTVLFGKKLLKKMLGTVDSPEAAVLAVCAHEYGHVVQNKLGLRGRLLYDQKTVRRLELHADFLAGYFAGLRKRQNPTFASAVFALTMFGLGDNNFAQKGHHGTSEERGAAVVAGFEVGRGDKKSFGDVVEEGVRYVGA